MKILVTGAGGQLGKSLAKSADAFPEHELVFFDRDSLDITNKDSCLGQIISDFDFCINTAAYTAVDAAEDNWSDAHAVNSTGVYNLAEACELANVRLIHISTDYVFPGEKSSPYLETDATWAKTAYGETKLRGEEAVLAKTKNGIVIRTSWMFSAFGNNFVKTMLKLGDKLNQISVVSDQVGSPTSAHDLADFLLATISHLQFKEDKPAIYHYVNSGVASWYDFSRAVMELSDKKCIVHPITTEQYPTRAKRPPYSVLSTQKIQKTFCLYPPKHWRDALQHVIELLAA